MKTLFIHGKHVPQPRQRHRVVLPSNDDIEGALKCLSRARDFRKWLQTKCQAQNYTPSNHPVQPWKQIIQLEWRTNFGTELMEGPIGLSLDFFRERPKAKVWKTKPMPREWDFAHTGDADNLTKAVCDALQGLAYKDDCQIAHIDVRRFICSGDDKPGVWLSLNTLDQIILNGGRKLNERQAICPINRQGL